MTKVDFTVGSRLLQTISIAHIESMLSGCIRFLFFLKVIKVKMSSASMSSVFSVSAFTS